MPIFQYKGYATDGSEVEGSVEAPGLRDAIATVKAQKILPTDVIEKGRMKKPCPFPEKG